MLKKIFIILIFFYKICYASTININTANVNQLTKLKGIGRYKAMQIVLYRQKNGKFLYTEDIIKVPGISYKTFDKIKLNINVLDDESCTTEPSVNYNQAKFKKLKKVRKAVQNNNKLK